MGEQIKVVDMVRNLIRLSGFIPEEEIPITFIGVRPDEKLYEELVASDEVVEPSAVPQIHRIRSLSQADPEKLHCQVRTLEQVASQGDAETLIKLLGEIVPTYRSEGGGSRSNAGAGAGTGTADDVGASPLGNGEQGPSGNGGETTSPVPAKQGAVNRER